MTTTFAPRPVPAPPGTYAFPRPAVHTLANGLRTELFAAQDRLISVALVIPGGANAETQGKEGAATLAAHLRTEGTAEHTGVELATALDLIGASMDSNVVDAASVTRIRVPQSGLVAALRLLRETVTTPTYPAGEFERLRAEAVQEARSQRSDPGSRAEIELRAAMFAPSDRASSPRGGSVESLTSLSREDIMAFDAAHLTPSGATLVIGGALDTDLAFLLEESGLAQWTGPDGLRSTTSTPAPSAPQVVVVDRPGAVQTEIRLGVVTPAATAEAFTVLSVASQVLGGSMNSRLSANLREEKGYTYGVGSAVQRMPERSRFFIATPVDGGSAPAAIADLVAIVDEFRTDGPSPAEIERSIDEMLLGAATQFQTVTAVVRERSDQLALALPDGWLDTHWARLRKVDAAAAAAAFAGCVPRDRLSAVFVGDANSILPTIRGIWSDEMVEVRAL